MTKALHAFKWLCIRSSIILVIISLIYVLCQDFLIFPSFTQTFQGKHPKNITIPKEIEQIFVDTEDGENIEVWYYAAEQPLRYTAIIHHGNGAYVQSSLGIQRWLSQIGIESYAYDYRGFGNSTGWPSEVGLYHDAEAVYELAESRSPQSPARFLSLGESIGSGPAAYLAQKHKFEILILLAGYTDLPSVARTRQIVGYLAPFLWYEFPVANYISQMNNQCIIAAHGMLDGVISFSHLAKLEQSFSGSGKFIKIALSATGHILFPEAQSKLEQGIEECSSMKAVF